MYDVEELIEETKVTNPSKRAKAVRAICPCKVKKNVEQLWDRIIEMQNDESADVRLAVLHNLLDGSPSSMEDRVMETVRNLQLDKDKRIKRICNKVLTVYRKTGKYNIL